MNKKLGMINVETVAKVKIKNMYIDLPENEYEKKLPSKTVQYFQNDRTITCVLSDGEVKAVGIATCHPDDELNISTGMAIAEMRATSNYYLKYAQMIIEDTY